jgi:hypothetical protein
MSERPVIVELTTKEAERLFEMLSESLHGPDMPRRPGQWYAEEWAQAELEIGALGALARAIGATAPAVPARDAEADGTIEYVAPTEVAS